MSIDYRHNAKGVYQARDHCRHCHGVVNHWHRCGQTPRMVLVCRFTDDGVVATCFKCPKCGKPSGIRARYGSRILESVDNPAPLTTDRRYTR